MNRRSLLAGLLFAVALPAADLWKTAPPPPASWTRGRVSDLAARRKAVAGQIGDKGILILYAAEPRNYAGDVDWPYRQENNFYYLTGIPQEGGALVSVPGAKVREILFMPASNSRQETWTGHILTPAEGRQISGIETVWDMRRLNECLSTLLPRAGSAFAEPAEGGKPGGLAPPPPIPLDVATVFAKQMGIFGTKDRPIFMTLSGAGAAAEFRREAEIAERLGALDPPLAVQDAAPILGRLRAIKSAREIDLLQHAVDITAEAFQRVYALSVPGTPEYELQAQFEFTFLRRNAHWGYPCIVASGVNATTLHYESNRDSMQAGDLLLLDDGAEFDGYSADVTRTIPVSGKYTREQATVYRLVWAAQKAAIDAARPGMTPIDVAAAADKVLGEGLFQLGLVSDPKSARQIHIWLSHGITHSIGLNVHDPGIGGKNGLGEYRPGMVVTMEPGLYFRLDALDSLPQTEENRKFIDAVKPAFEKYKGIGIRIEDDIAIGNGQARVMSANIPSKLEDVEADIAQLRRTVRSAPPL